MCLHTSDELETTTTTTEGLAAASSRDVSTSGHLQDQIHWVGLWKWCFSSFSSLSSGLAQDETLIWENLTWSSRTGDASSSPVSFLHIISNYDYCTFLKINPPWIILEQMFWLGDKVEEDGWIWLVRFLANCYHCSSYDILRLVFR